MKKIIRITESELISLVKGIINEQLTQPAGNSQTFGVPSWTPELKGANLSCIDPKLFTQKNSEGKSFYVYNIPSSIPNGVVEVVVLYSDGMGTMIVRGTHNKGRWRCGTNGVEFISDADPKAIRHLGKIEAPKSPAANTANCAASLSEITKGSNKILKFGCKTEGVKELQKLLGMDASNQTGYFGNVTKAKVIEFQRANKDSEGIQLKDDGIFGDKTHAVMAYKKYFKQPTQ